MTEPISFLAVLKPDFGRSMPLLVFAKEMPITYFLVLYSYSQMASQFALKNNYK